MLSPAKSLKDAYNSLDPTIALPGDDPRYIDCDSVRGDENVVKMLLKCWPDILKGQKSP